MEKSEYFQQTVLKNLAILIKTKMTLDLFLIPYAKNKFLIVQRHKYYIKTVKMLEAIVQEYIWD